MYKGYWGIVSGDTKCPDPAASTAKAKETEVRNKEIAAWKDKSNTPPESSACRMIK